MSYAKLIDRKLTQAFNILVKDLAKDAVIERKTDVAFDFESGEVDGGSQKRTFKCVIIDRKKPSPDRPTKRVQIMLKAADVGEIMVHDEVTLDGESYRVGDVVKSDGYISLIDLFKE